MLKPILNCPKCKGKGYFFQGPSTFTTATRFECSCRIYQKTSMIKER